MNRPGVMGILAAGLAVLLWMSGGQAEAQASSGPLEAGSAARAGFQVRPGEYVPLDRVSVRDHLCFVSSLSQGSAGIPGCPGSLVFVAPLIALGFAWAVGVRHPGALAALGAVVMSGTSMVALSNPVGILVVVLASLSIGGLAWVAAR